jgi:hypothetical protein
VTAVAKLFHHDANGGAAQLGAHVHANAERGDWFHAGQRDVRLQASWSAWWRCRNSR